MRAAMSRFPGSITQGTRKTLKTSNTGMNEGWFRKFMKKEVKSHSTIIPDQEGGQT